MPKVHTIHAAKTHFSRLVAQADRGETVVIARGRQPVAKLGHPRGATGAQGRRASGPGARDRRILRTAAGR